jgi:dTDP-4-dehydrorhamnose reductase
MMRFLVVGASGFVGQHLLARIREAGYEAVGTRSGREMPGLIRFDLANDRIGERLGPDFFNSRVPVKAVVCAAISPMETCFREKEKTFLVNVRNTIRLVDDLAGLGAETVFISSSYVFSGEDGYYREEDDHGPVSEYGRQKSIVDQYVRERYPASFVPRLDRIVGDDPAEKHLFSEWYELIIREEPITCIADQILAPTLVDDVARAVIRGCELGLRGAYHVANAEFFARDELARQFARALGLPARIEARPQSSFGFLDRRPQRSYLNSARFIRATGFRFTSMGDVFTIFRDKLLGARRH